MSDEKEYTAAIADMDDTGAFVVKTLDYKKITIYLGPAQIVSLKRAVDRFVANYEVTENANKGNVAR